MGVTIVEEPIRQLAAVADVPIAYMVDRIIEVEAGDLTERPVDQPWVKDYDAIPGHAPADWARRFDVSNWGLLFAKSNDIRVGAAVVARATPGLDMLGDRRDLAVLWDLRVHPDERGQGMGARLFTAAAGWARRHGCRRLEVETQNVNVAACRLYERMGCELARLDPHAYPERPGELELVWGLDL